MPTASFSTDGFVLVSGVLPETECLEIAGRITLPDHQSAGSRCLLAEPWCTTLADRIRSSPLFAGLIPRTSVCVQCTYFEKSIQRNWIVPIHQDLSIPVVEQISHPRLHGWSRKEGELFVQSPPEVLEQLVAVRVHIDPCGANDGPVRVYCGSHSLGRIDPAAAVAEKNNFKEVECTAEVGTALVMRPLLLHASSKATGSSLRRVLHFLFGQPMLPLGLRWRYAV